MESPICLAGRAVGALVTALVAGALVSCARTVPVEVSADGATVRLAGACTDGSRTVLQLETVLDLNELNLEPSSFLPPNARYFVTSISFVQDGHLFSSTSSMSKSDPVLSEDDLTAKVAQEFRFPGAPSSGSQMSLKATVTLLNAPGTRVLARDIGLPVQVGECR
jgi:hypothetical protein